MSVRVVCDVCGELMPLRRYRLRVTGDPHPHTGEQIRGLNVIDICGPCLERVPDLATERTALELRISDCGLRIEEPNWSRDSANPQSAIPNPQSEGGAA